MNLVFRLTFSVSACGFGKHGFSVFLNSNTNKWKLVGSGYITIKKDLFSFGVFLMTAKKKWRPIILVFLIRCLGYDISAHSKNIGDFLAFFRLNTEIIFSEFDVFLPFSKDAVCVLRIGDRIDLGTKTVYKIVC